jgi:hypothetical protein
LALCVRIEFEKLLFLVYAAELQQKMKKNVLFGKLIGPTWTNKS